MLQLKHMLWRHLNLSEVGIKLNQILSKPDGIAMVDRLISAYDAELFSLDELMNNSSLPCDGPLVKFKLLRGKFITQRVELKGLRELLLAGISVDADADEPVADYIYQGVERFSKLV